MPLLHGGEAHALPIKPALRREIAAKHDTVSYGTLFAIMQSRARWWDSLCQLGVVGPVEDVEEEEGEGEDGARPLVDLYGQEAVGEVPRPHLVLPRAARLLPLQLDHHAVAVFALATANDLERNGELQPMA